MKKRMANLQLVYPSDKISREADGDRRLLSTIDLFCGAGGITEGFREAQYRCLYAHDCMPAAGETFQENHPGTWAECENIERVKPAEIRAKLKLRKGQLDVLVGG